MKDTVITARAKRRELLVFSGCFLAAFLANVYAIVEYRTSWTELFSQIGYVLVIAVSLYALCWIIRLAARVLLRLIEKR
ncbi:MAG: hypothetical protein NC115_02810 [Bacteroidales bacterium]|nr:hypothetical protein [Bacteroides sp.]MCM1197748.1 hypothetical protein [Clostridium sp.]MCM1501585.1 hypothetical protein [Bacteroidales bacterium]